MLVSLTAVHIFQGSSMHIWEKPIFSSLTEAYVWQWLWVCLSLQSKVTIVWLPLLGAMAKNQTDLLASAQMACSQ